VGPGSKAYPTAQEQREVALFENPFRSPGNWYRANLHAHTTVSDGNLSPAECAEFYRRIGHQILAITDHWHVDALTSDRPDFLIMHGVELSGGRSAQGTDYHIVGLNMKRRGEVARPKGATAQEIVDFVREDGGEALIAHPYWSGLMAPDMAGIQGCFGIEVYNTGCDLEILRGFSMVQWDDLLTLGCDFGGVAVDDGHDSPADHGLGWTMIRAEELSTEAVVEALRQGRYYSSTGPEIKDIGLTDGRLRVSASRVKSIALVSSPAQGSRRLAPARRTITRAEFALPPPQYARYCRVEISDRNGKKAWSNPILLNRPQPHTTNR